MAGSEVRWASLDEGRLAGVAVLGRGPQQVVAAPVMAPVLIGWVVFAADLDEREMHSLERLSAIPLNANVMVESDDRWSQAAAAMRARPDPSCPQSRAAWAVVEQLLPGGAKVPPEGRSAAQAKAMFPMFQEIIDREMAREQMRARSEEGRLNRAHEARLAGMRRGAGLGGAREADVQKLGKDTEGLAQVQNDLALLEKTISGTGDIPGAGVWDSKKPAFMQSGDDINIRQAAVRVAARLLHEQSGASVTPSEAERFMEGRGLGPGATEDQFRAGIQALASELRAALRAKAAKYRPEVVQTLQRRGGVVDLGAPPPAAGAPETRTVGGKRYERDADGQWYEVG
jgi:hypothetical protein